MQAAAEPPGWDAPTSVLAGVGPARAAALARAGIVRVGDLVCLSPASLYEWPQRVPLESLRERLGEQVVVRGRLSGVRHSRLGGKRSLVRLRFEGHGAELEALLFNQPWLAKQLSQGLELELVGVPGLEGSRCVLRAQALGTHESPLPAAGTLEPRYAAIEGVGAALLARSCRELARRLAGQLDDPLPARLLAKLELPPLCRALQQLHEPSSRAHFEAARRRLRFEELLRLQAALANRRREGRREPARRADVSERTARRFRASLPFELTAAQQRVIAELRADLDQELPMRRLLHGDVGSGKTSIALYAIAAVASAGGQVALLAPTSLLAEQHAAGLRRALEALGLRSGLLTAALPARARREREAQLARGELDVVFGTHALISAGLEFARLDLAVIDEQHRFGVTHRRALIDKGRGVHLLLMTATPIPRTLALSLYGDLDVSLLDELPPGRGRLVTKWVQGAQRRRILSFLGERLGAGEQAFWVCPRIGDEASPEEGPTVSAERRFQALARKPLAAFGIELVHGRLAPEERSRRLERFRAGEVRLLVATTVIEVGVDVPAATVIVIEDAQRLGLAALHQLRGRVGRGTRDSWCLLLGSKAARARLELLERSRDGFQLAEQDLRARGMGELAGLRQSGGAAGLGSLEDEADLGLLAAARRLVQRDERLARRYGSSREEVVP